MPTIKNNDATIYFEEHGNGFPILTFAPAGAAIGDHTPERRFGRAECGRSLTERHHVSAFLVPHNANEYDW